MHYRHHRRGASGHSRYHCEVGVPEDTRGVLTEGVDGNTSESIRKACEASASFLLWSLRAHAHSTH